MRVVKMDQEYLEREINVISETLKRLKDYKELEIRLKALEIELNINDVNKTEYIHELDNIRKRLKDD